MFPTTVQPSSDPWTRACGDLRNRQPHDLDVVPAVDAAGDREISGHVVRRHGRWLSAHRGSAGGAAPWGGLLGLAAAAVIGAVLATAIDQSEPDVPGAAIGMGVLIGYSGVAMLLDWIHARREKP